ncbi:MAG: hypothetical protein JWR44_236 [Hymenobacter sp.]|nr:hypothetical protein [Hymenobacter sp.]
MGLCPYSQAQDPRLMNFKSFLAAAVVLNSGVIMTGSLRFYYDQDIIALTCANDSTYTLSAHLVRGFVAKDDPIQQRPEDTYITLQRIFRTFSLPTGKDSLPAKGFYEQLSRGPGPVLLLRREQVVPVLMAIPPTPVSSNANPGPAPRTFSFQSAVITNTLYLGTATGTLVVLRKPAAVFKHFAQHASQLHAYARQNKLHYTDNIRDLSFLVNYANTLPNLKP